MLGRIAASIALMAALVATAACGADTGRTHDSDSSDGSANGAFPVTVKTAFGDVTVKQRPKRVVALGWGDAETALALGVQPVGASDWLDFGGNGVGPWAKGRYDKPPTMIGTREPELEKIAALRPDLILDVNSSGDKKRHAALSKIAPVVGVPPGGKNYGVGWREHTKVIATALGKAEKGRRLVKQVDDLFAKKAKQFPQFADKTIVIASRTSEGWGAYTSADQRVRFAESLGFRLSPAIKKRSGDSFSTKISEERLGLLDADLTVVMPIYVKPSVVTSDPLFKQVPSVADGRVVIFKDRNERLAFSTGTTLALKYALKKVPPVFAAALKN